MENEEEHEVIDYHEAEFAVDSSNDSHPTQRQALDEVRLALQRLHAATYRNTTSTVTDFIVIVGATRYEDKQVKTGVTTYASQMPEYTFRGLMSEGQSMSWRNNRQDDDDDDEYEYE